MNQETALEKLLEEHHSTLNGLSSIEAKKRLVLAGPNELKAKKRKSFLVQFLEEFKDLMVIILILATVLAFIGGETTDALIILFIVILNATIGFIQKFKAERAIEALKKMIAPSAKVLRDGEVKKILARDIVPGDILILEEGEQIPADAILLEANELQTQEASLNGESTAIEKNTYNGTIKAENTLFMGTNVVHGTGRAIAIKTGMDTEMGKIATLTRETIKDKSPLQKELQRIGLFAGKMTFVICTILLLFGIFIQKRELIETLLFATSVAVAAVPEGLPATITIALAMGVQRLAKNNTIVKQLSSVETLGATTVICSDKTGTLTKNEMTVEEVYFDESSAKVEGSGYNPEGAIKISTGENSSTLELLLRTAGLCNNANLQEENGRWNVVGDPTEGALITLVKKSTVDLDSLKKEYQKLHEYAFDSTRKCMSVLYEEKSSGKIFIFVKGAPHNVLEKCAHLTKERQTQIIEKNNSMAKNALRVLAFAYKELSAEDQKAWKEGSRTFKKEDLEKGLSFLGFTGMIDPPRSEVKEAIRLAKAAGIKIYVITGDHGLTAEAIAKNLGIITHEKHLILSGEELNQISDIELKNLLSDKNLEIIFSRVSPEHKLRVVSALKELGEIVAVTGDGVNDAPALKRSDIGVAMGSGTDVSKEAANMILTDDSFSTIVKAIKEGRTIYENLKKFVFFVFSGNIGELFTIFGAIVLNLPAPLTAILILCVNLFTDILPALALALEPAEENIMLKKPRASDEKILSRAFLFRMFYNGSFIGIVVISTFVFELFQNGWTWGETLDPENYNYIKASSTAFVILVMMQMAHAFNAKSETISILKSGFLKNTKLLMAVFISIAITVCIVEIPLLQGYLHTTGLSSANWFTIAVTSLSIIVVEELRKWISTQKTRLQSP